MSKVMTECKIWRQSFLSLLYWNILCSSTLQLVILEVFGVHGHILFCTLCWAQLSYFWKGWMVRKGTRGETTWPILKSHTTPREKRRSSRKVEDHNALLIIHLLTGIPGSDSPWAAKWWRLGDRSGTDHCVPALFLLWSLGSLHWPFYKTGCRITTDINIAAQNHSFFRGSFISYI